MKNYVEELKWRGMLQDIMPGTEEQLMKEMTTAYAGFDPTADSLHIGNMVPIMLLKHLQMCGHKPIALVGGATGMIGDPSGKSSERNFLSEDVLKHNLNCQRKQLEKFLDFNKGENAAEIVNNYDWFKEMGFLNFLRDVGKHITVSYMMAKDSVQNRLESGISFTEFSYQLVQGYDFYYLNENKNCKLQVGGSDQWGNIVTGTELIRRKSGKEAFALTCPLITKSDGTKFGKSEGGNVWLDPNRTSPYKFYQFWLNVSDADASRYIRIFTLLTKPQIEALEEEHAKAAHLRVLQKALAKEITTTVHSEKDFEAAVEASKILFGEGTRETLEKLSEADLLTVFEGVPQFSISSKDLETGLNLIDLLADKTNIFPSRSEAKKMIQAGGVSINKNKMSDISVNIMHNEVLSNNYILAQKGKKNYYLIKVQ
jgi:tyrosyl-tRNA synthetase